MIIIDFLLMGLNEIILIQKFGSRLVKEFFHIKQGYFSLEKGSEGKKRKNEIIWIDSSLGFFKLIMT